MASDDADGPAPSSPFAGAARLLLSDENAGTAVLVSDRGEVFIRRDVAERVLARLLRYAETADQWMASENSLLRFWEYCAAVPHRAAREQLPADRSKTS